jgi:GT2 family glycosyltransferase
MTIETPDTAAEPIGPAPVGSMLPMATVSVVVLTMGDRPAELAAAIASARRQRGVEVEVVMVVNGGEPDRTLADTAVEPGENLGIPGGRNAGAAAANGEHLCFLDDDGALIGDRVLVEAADAMAVKTDLAVVALRIVDEQGTTSRRHHPGLRANPTISADVTSFPGGGCVIRRTAFTEAGGLCDQFTYGLEETDLAWRLIDLGRTIRYRADLTMRHPRTDPARHPSFHRGTARNRVWLAHRRLPIPLAIAYVGNWLAISALRNLTRPRAIGAVAAGTLEGLRTRIGPREPMTFATARRLSRLGRPPVI